MFRKGIQLYNQHGFTTALKQSVSYIYKQIDDLTIPISNSYFNMQYGAGTSIFERDWDNLILFDACRYDEFVKVSPFRDDIVEPRVTLGSRTPQFLHRTFDGENFHDLVYVTANPQVLRYSQERGDNPFYDIVSVVDKWDEESQTIHPKDVHTAALEAEAKYPNKKLLIHFLQPHAPFLGPTARGSRDRTGKSIKGLDPGREYTEIEPQNIETTSYNDILLLDEDLGISEIRRAYRESLAITTCYVADLVGKLHGKTAVSADHGELLGDQIHPLGSRRWEHPGNIRCAPLCVVPWVSFPASERKSIRSDPPNNIDQREFEDVNRQLKSLGYV